MTHVDQKASRPSHRAAQDTGAGPGVPGALRWLPHGAFPYAEAHVPSVTDAARTDR